MKLKSALYLIVFLGGAYLVGKKLIIGLNHLMSGETQYQSNLDGRESRKFQKNTLAQMLYSPKTNTTLLPRAVEIPAECKGYFAEILNVDLSSYRSQSFKVTYAQIPRAARSCVIMDEFFGLAEKQYFRSCFASNPTTSDSLSVACVNAFTIFRSSTTRFLWGSSNLRNIDDVSELADLLFAEFSYPVVDKSQSLDLPRIATISKKILDIDSKYLLAEKALFFINFSRTKQDSVGKTLRQQDEMWESLLNDFNAFKTRAQIQAASFKLTDLSVAIETRGFEPKRTLDFVTKALSSNPKDCRALYLKGLSAFQSEDHEEAFKSVKAATECEPGNEGYSITLRDLKTGEATVDSFTQPLKLGLSSQDFDN